MSQLSGKTPSVRVQFHRDQNVGELREFWSNALGIDPDGLRFHPKTNSGELRTRVWRCAHGVAAVDLHDTYFRARIGAWMDRIRSDWS